MMILLGETFGIGGTQVAFGTVLMLLLYFGVWFWLRETASGRHVYAVGNNPEATRLTGIPTLRVLLGVHVLAGALYGVAALLSVARTGVGDPNAGQTENLDAITAVVLGRHQPVRRPRRRAGHAARRADRRRAAQRPDADRRAFRLSGIDHRHPGDSCGGHRSTVPERSPLMVAHPLVMQAQGLSKRYGQVTALDGADFELRQGEILAVIGDNGAGKSSLIKCLSGATIPDQGSIRLDGKAIQFRSPIDARRAGIETVYQDLAVAAAMSISENLFLGREIRRKGPLGMLLRMLDKKEMLAQSVARMSELKVGIRSMTQPVETLSGGQRQCVAVARAAAFARHVVIMDEPTAALGVKEGNMVLELIRRVRDKGLSVVLISHNMPHVFEIADRIHVARLGRRACVLDPRKISMSDTVAVMTGAVRPEELPADALAH